MSSLKEFINDYVGDRNTIMKVVAVDEKTEESKICYLGTADDAFWKLRTELEDIQLKTVYSVTPEIKKNADKKLIPILKIKVKAPYGMFGK